MAVISKKTWTIFVVLACLAVFAWQKYTYPQLTFINLSVDRPMAVERASQYLIDQKILSPTDLAQYHHAAIFLILDSPDRYLQKALGYKEELSFLKEHKFELFYWSVRFFKENQQEEYRLTVSAGTGNIHGYMHVIEDSAPRPEQTEEQAKNKASSFLQKKFDFDLERYELYTNTSQKRDHRTDYYFSWKKKGVFLPWSPEKDTGGAKLIAGATISGDEILNFYHNRLEIPDQFSRYMERIQNVGRNLSLLFRMTFYIILVSSIFFVVVRRNDLVMQSVKNFTIGLTAFVFLLHLASYFNEFQSVLYYYPTTTPLSSYLWRNIVSTAMETFIAVLSILMPCLAGESLHHEVFPQREKREGGFLHYLRSTFFSRSLSKTILLGYLTALTMIGIQSLAFEVGQRYLGVWIEYSWMAQLSGSYWPLLGAFILGSSAGLGEEICFRLFGINFGKKFFKNTAMACLVASIIWGYGHSGYQVFPMWFRGLEVTCMGLFLCFVYLRFGILATITAHYLFDVFWGCSAYLLGNATAGMFYSSIAILLLPLVWAIAAYILNQPDDEKPLRWKLSRHQIYNLAILKHYLHDKNLLATRTPEQLKHEIASHGWDLAVVEIALEDLKADKGKQ